MAKRSYAVHLIPASSGLGVWGLSFMVISARFAGVRDERASKKHDEKNNHRAKCYFWYDHIGHFVSSCADIITSEVHYVRLTAAPFDADQTSWVFGHYE